MAANIHPAVWVVAWCLLAVIAQRLDLRWLAGLTLPAFVLVVAYAPRDSLRLLWRARWLLFGIAIVFVAATPGERLPGAAGTLGVTFDGLAVAAEHLMRLSLLLGTLATLLHGLGKPGLFSALHVLLRPIGDRRERVAVRLALALEYAERPGSAKRWRDWLNGPANAGQDRVQLSIVPMTASDAILLVLLAAAGAGIFFL